MEHTSAAFRASMLKDIIFLAVNIFLKDHMEYCVHNDLMPILESLEPEISITEGENLHEYFVQDHLGNPDFESKNWSLEGKEWLDYGIQEVQP